MSRILVHVEGHTEEAFVNRVLAPHLCELGYTSVRARLLGNARQRSRRGGIRPWNSVRQDILNHLREDETALATTMVDYYGLPYTWPGREQAGAGGADPQRNRRVARRRLPGYRWAGPSCRRVRSANRQPSAVLTRRSVNTPEVWMVAGPSRVRKSIR